MLCAWSFIVFRSCFLYPTFINPTMDALSSLAFVFHCFLVALSPPECCFHVNILLCLNWIQSSSLLKVSLLSIPLSFFFLIKFPPSMILCNTNGAHFSPRWSLVCQLRWRRCRRSIWVPSWTPHQAASSSTSPSLWPHWQTSRRTAWVWQPQVWASACPCETPTTGNGRPVPSACLSGDTPCKWIMMITQMKQRQNISW